MLAVTHITIPLSELHEMLRITNLNERQRRELSGFLASKIGYGGIAAVSRAFGMSAKTVRKGYEEFLKLSENNLSPSAIEKAPRPKTAKRERIRRPGGGRKSLLVKYPRIQQALLDILESTTYGDPMRVITWTTLSLRMIQEILKSQGFKASHTAVGELIELLGYSKQVNQKMLQVNEPHPDRDAQFAFINEKSKEFLSLGLPVVSVDCKKKENLGNFKNSGAEYRPKRNPRPVLDHDFVLPELGKVAPYGIYVLNDNTAFVNLGTSSDTAEFAGESLGRWWHAVGMKNSTGNKLYVVCDVGGSNGARVRLWKFVLAQMAELYGIEIHVSHLPPGTSKWNKVEHRLLCYITQNWQGQPLTDIETVVNLISSTKTKKGLVVDCVVDDNKYRRSTKISADEFEKIDLEKIGEFGQWNYVIRGFKHE